MGGAYSTGSFVNVYATSFSGNLHRGNGADINVNGDGEVTIHDTCLVSGYSGTATQGTALDWMQQAGGKVIGTSEFLSKGWTPLHSTPLHSHPLFSSPLLPSSLTNNLPAH